MWLRIFIIFFVFSFFNLTYSSTLKVTTIKDDSVLAKENSASIQPKKVPVFFIKQGILMFDDVRFTKYVNLKKKQHKKIDKIYKRYLKDQLKLKSKVSILSVKLTEIEFGYDDNFALESAIDKTFDMKSKMFFNNYVLLKQIEKILKKDQRATYIKITNHLYMIEI